MSKSPIEPKDLKVVRTYRLDHELLVTLEAYEFEAFGFTGLRTYDLAVMAQAGAVYLAYLEDEVVGSCQLLRMFDEPGFFYIVGFYVRPMWQRRHVGRALLAAMAGEIRQSGGQGMVLTVAPSNKRAIDLYKRAGFVEETFVPRFYGDREDRYILRWRFERGGLPGSV